MTISEEVKQRCVELHKQGKSQREIYREYFSLEHPGMSFETFRHKILKWERRYFADPETR